MGRGRTAKLDCPFPTTISVFLNILTDSPNGFPIVPMVPILTRRRAVQPASIAEDSQKSRLGSVSSRLLSVSSRLPIRDITTFIGFITAFIGFITTLIGFITASYP